LMIRIPATTITGISAELRSRAPKNDASLIRNTGSIVYQKPSRELFMPTDLRVHHLEMNRRRALGLLASGALFAFGGAPVSAAERLKGEALRKAFVKRFERPRVALAPEAGAVETKVGIVYEKWTIASEA